jgi:pyridoxal phosphate enzyme (YggS family)
MSTVSHETTIQKNYLAVLERIAAAAQKAGRDPEEVRLVVVTKGHTVDIVQAVVEAGAKRLGENYVEEGIGKITALGLSAGVEWDMIGHVQSRKARQVCEYFSCIQSLDSLKLANRLDRFSQEFNRALPVLLEFNVSGEETKSGFPAYQEEAWEELLSDLAQIVQLSNLRVQGLMTMAPFLPDPEDARIYFRRLRRLQNFLAQRFPQTEWKVLSMGMSADFVAAIQEGSTLVRIGTAILGPRPI